MTATEHVDRRKEVRKHIRASVVNKGSWRRCSARSSAPPTREGSVRRCDKLRQPPYEELPEQALRLFLGLK